jgi:hypothetical protein
MAALPIDQILALYPSLEQVQPALDQLEQSLAFFQVPAETVLFSENAACQGFSAGVARRNQGFAQFR